MRKQFLSPVISGSWTGSAFLLLTIFFPVLTACTQQTFAEMANEMAGAETKIIKVENIEKGAIFLDAREKDEYIVSHIPNARYVGYDDFVLSSCSDIPKDQLIVVYCSVGYRSGNVTEDLEKAGYTEVYNLWGGIFNWVNTGHEVVNSKGATQNVHPYDEQWGKWLTRGNKVYE
jgi:rhodanese-related sulfurtransferase